MASERRGTAGRRAPAKRRAPSRRRGSSARRRGGSAFTFAAASLACLALALGAVLACGLLRKEKPEPILALPEAGPPGLERPAEAPSPAPPAEPSPPRAPAQPPAPKAAPPSLPAAAGRSERSVSPQKSVSRKSGSRKSTLRRVQPPRPRVPAAPRRTLVFVIDDAGYNLSELEPFLRLPFPLTVAVLPRLPYSEKAAAAIRSAGKELILHQPMAALGGQDPGPGAIYPDSQSAEIARILAGNFETVPGAVGMNNHMGSAVTTEAPLMDAVAAIAKKRGIYYLDSLTVSGTASREAAHREGIRYWERDVFLDNAPDRVTILRAVEDGKKQADSGRPAVMIGHVWSAELAKTLMELYPQLVDEGYSLSTISRYMLSESSDDADSRD